MQVEATNSLSLSNLFVRLYIVYRCWVFPRPPPFLQLQLFVDSTPLVFGFQL